MKHAIAHVAPIVRDDDEAIAYHTRTLGFTLVEDTDQPEQDERWVIVAPAGSSAAACTRLAPPRARRGGVRPGPVPLFRGRRRTRPPPRDGEGR